MQTIPPKSVVETRDQIIGQSLTWTSPHIDEQPVQNTVATGPSSCAVFETSSSTKYDLFYINSFPYPERATIKQEQLDFCILQFKDIILQLVHQNRAPFIHHDSYQLAPPVAYQDLLGISAMYCQKTPQNQTITFSMLDSRISSLIGSSKSSAWSANDYLVGVQAMIIYQIIRLFDGDIRQRAKAEGQFRILETWISQLHSISNYDESGTKSPYQRWIFIESVRRSLTMSIMVHAIYSILKDGYCTSVPQMTTLPVSVNGALWVASEDSWWQTTLGLGGELITYQDFLAQWNEGQALYTGTYESILIGACKHNVRWPPLMLL
ncbi:hypothetical protein V496_05912 [Pseudogymnoascus sp. VKM F-4515 (FW-2607)]|nr:hypothetical protein V496_05912 [Pseudogymnoascus sp. VKM F-4515 (FW-2607)]KFY99424.1 hypothetical protein V498_00777 [Pseudogymnoascus sp. VKM F-4517 (FW-2822)]